jgi:hypothetical protein
MDVEAIKIDGDPRPIAVGSGRQLAHLAQGSCGIVPRAEAGLLSPDPTIAATARPRATAAPAPRAIATRTFTAHPPRV